MIKTPSFPLFILLLLCSCSSNSQETKNNKVTLLFVGDLMQHQGQIDAARTPQGYDYSACFKLVKDEIDSADIAIGNLEVTLGGKPYKGYPQFSAPDEFLYAIRDAGFDVLLTANNHCLDRGQKGLERTIAKLDSLGIPYAGTYQNNQIKNVRYPLILEKKGIRIALLNYTYGTNGFKTTGSNVVNYIDKTAISRDIELARAQKVDVIIACMHWGEEYKQIPSNAQKEMATWLIKQGVNHVIGSHPHVVQPIVVQTDSLSQQKNVIAYSLGNYISNMSAPNTDGGLMLKLELTKDSITYLSNSAYSLIWVGRPILTREKNHKLIPVRNIPPTLPIEARNRLILFTKSTEKLFNKHNHGISEYHF